MGMRGHVWHRQPIGQEQLLLAKFFCCSISRQILQLRDAVVCALHSLQKGGMLLAAAYASWMGATYLHEQSRQTWPNLSANLRMYIIWILSGATRCDGSAKHLAEAFSSRLLDTISLVDSKRVAEDFQV